MKDELEEFIAKNREQFDTSAPPAQVLGRILERMQPQKTNRQTGIVISFRAIRWVAACVVFFTLTTLLLLQDKRKEAAPAAAKVKPPTVQQISEPAIQADRKPVQGALDAIDRELLQRKETLQAKLKKHEVAPGPEPGPKVSLASLSDMSSPANRITAATAAKKLMDEGNDVVDALVGTLNTDPNSNVRLAALDGLARFYRENYVRQQLVKALKKQHDPVVQVAMINLLVRMRVSGILEQLDSMVSDDNTNKAVKDCAYSGLLELKAI